MLNPGPFPDMLKYPICQMDTCHTYNHNTLSFKPFVGIRVTHRELKSKKKTIFIGLITIGCD